MIPSSHAARRRGPEEKKMGMKRAREVLSATAEVAISGAPPHDPALPKPLPQPVPPPGRLLPPPRPPLPVPALPPAPAPGRPPPAAWLPPPATSMPRLVAPPAPPVGLLPQGRGLATEGGTRPQLCRCDRRARAQHGRGRGREIYDAFAAVPARPFRSLCFRCAVLHSLRVSRTDLLSPLSTHDGTIRAVVVYCMYVYIYFFKY